MDNSKIPSSLALFELILDDVKVKIVLIPWHFLVVFWMQPPPTQLLTTSCFGILNVFR